MKQILQTVLNVILTKATSRTTKPQCSLEEQNQAPGRTEQGTGRGVKRFTWRRSIISLLRTYVRSSRLNTAQEYYTIRRYQNRKHYEICAYATQLGRVAVNSRIRNSYSSRGELQAQSVGYGSRFKRWIRCACHVSGFL